MDKRRIAIGGLIGLLILLSLGVGIFVMNGGGNIAMRTVGADIGFQGAKVLGASPANSQGNGNPTAPGLAIVPPNGAPNPGNGNPTAPGAAIVPPNGAPSPGNGNTQPGVSVNANPSSNVNGNANLGNTGNANPCLAATNGSAQGSLCSNLSQMPTGNVNTGQ